MKYLPKILKKLPLSDEQAKRVLSIGNDEGMLSCLVNEVGIEHQQIIEQLELYYGFKYVDLSQIKVGKSLVNQFDKHLLGEGEVLPYDYDSSNEVYHFALTEILSQRIKQTLSKICREKGASADFKFAFAHEIKNKLSNLSHSTERNDEDTGFAVKWMENIINKGIDLDSSDIHIEPQENSLQVRYRVDGVLSIKDIYDFDEDRVQNIIARLKVMANMMIAERRKPQDGRIDNFEHDKGSYDLRVSTVNTTWGEKAVLRLFNTTSRILSFSELGFQKEEEDRILKLISKTHGIVYLSGATGSGKTTTLYTMINAVNTDDVNIYTIENPVEKDIENVNQIQIVENAGVTYAAILKSLLRQDPDVIVVGEVRDNETAELSIRASLTGHLVFATIHANNALETISRLYNMDVEPYFVASAALGFISQRLMRLLCPYCKKKVEMSEEDRAIIEVIRRKYDELACIDGLGEIYEPVGCDRCSGIGYKGRKAMAEIVVVTPKVKKMIINKDPIDEIYHQVREEGFLPLEAIALKAVSNGETSIEELVKLM